MIPCEACKFVDRALVGVVPVQVEFVQKKSGSAVPNVHCTIFACTINQFIVLASKITCPGKLDRLFWLEGMHEFQVFSRLSTRLADFP